MSLYELPPEPLGPVWDRDGDKWWRNEAFGRWTIDSIIYHTWEDLLADYGPLTDVPPAPKVGDSVTMEQFADLPLGSVAAASNTAFIVTLDDGVLETGFLNRVNTDGPLSGLPLTLLRLGEGYES